MPPTRDEPIRVNRAVAWCCAERVADAAAATWLFRGDEAAATREGAAVDVAPVFKSYSSPLLVLEPHDDVPGSRRERTSGDLLDFHNFLIDSRAS